MVIPKSKPRVIPIQSQANRIRGTYTNWLVKNRRGKIICLGIIQPTAFSPQYVVLLTYSRRMLIPHINLLSPQMEKRNGKWPPHLYKKKRFCLFYPKYKEWTKEKFIADTIIPWISSWLYYYENWLINGGEWMGGGTNHSDSGEIEVERPPLLFSKGGWSEGQYALHFNSLFTDKSLIRCLLTTIAKNFLIAKGFFFRGIKAVNDFNSLTSSFVV